jgi:hypothetical protein
MTNTWFDINKLDSKENEELVKIFHSEIIQSCQLTLIYEFYECRNSYNLSTSAISMFNNFGFHFDIEVIKERIEATRKKGSYFEVHEVPCISLNSNNKSLVIFPKSCEKLYWTFLHRLEEKEKESTELLLKKENYFRSAFRISKFNEFYEHFKLNQISELNCFIKDTENTIPFKFPLNSYRSENEGSGYYYSFSKYGNSSYQKHIQSYLKTFTFLNTIISSY